MPYCPGLGYTGCDDDIIMTLSYPGGGEGPPTLDTMTGADGNDSLLPAGASGGGLDCWTDCRLTGSERAAAPQSEPPSDFLK